MELSKTSGSLLIKYIGRKRERQTERGEKERDRKAIKTPNPLRDVLLAELDVMSDFPACASNYDYFTFEET